MEELPPSGAAAIVAAVLLALLLLSARNELPQIFFPSQEFIGEQNQVSQTQTDAETAKQQTQPRHDALDILTVMAAVAAAIFTALLAHFAFLQIAETRTSNERQLRAYVGVTKATIGLEGVRLPRPGAGLFDRIELRGTLTIQNKGQTPAYNLRGTGAIRWGASFNKVWLQELRPWDQNSYLIPDAEYNFRSLSDIADLSAARPDEETEPWTFYWFGRVDYEDAFGRKRWTNFRFEIGGDLLGQIGGRATVHPCEEGNDAN
jgi:hypothetical protein